MMSLVSYDNSSDSENEENEVIEQSGGKVKLNGTSRSLNVESTIHSANTTVPLNVAPAASGELFTNLPQPKTRSSNVIEEEQDEFLQKKEQSVEKPQKVKQPVKIGILSLSDFNSDEEDDDNEPARKKSKQAKAPGLFALLPAPKVTPLSATSFVPNVLKKKANPTSKIQPQKKTKSSETVERPETTTKSMQLDDDDDIDVPETFDDETWQKVCGKQKRTVKPAVQEDTSTVYQDISYAVESAPDVEKPYSGLDNEAFKELIGNRKKMKENIEIIDIHEDEIRPDREEWLKSLTDPNCEPQADPKNPVNNTCKTKNHITALAQKALANDKELQMRWAESRHSRRQTQAKYGF